MATSGTPYEGRDSVVGPMIYTVLTSASLIKLVLYENTADSLGDSTVFANLTTPSGETGYADATLGTGWSFSSGVFQYDDGTPDNLSFTNSGAGAWGNAVIGAAMICQTPYTGSTWYVLHFKDFANAITLGAGESIEVDINTLVGN
jgi:hypothetical protein